MASFVLSKILWGLFAPANLLLFAMIAGVLLERTARPKLKKTGRFLCLSAIAFAVILVLLPLGTWALIPLENRFSADLPDRASGIVVIGGDENPDISEARGQATALDSTRRYIKMLEMSRRYPNARLVFAGGSGKLTRRTLLSEADVASEIMGSLGLPADRIVFENASRNTYENAVFATRLARPQPGETWLLITSAAHMPRAMACFTKAGWNVRAVPAGYATTGRYGFSLSLRIDEQLRLLTTAAHEYIGLVSYRLMNRIDSIWPEQNLLPPLYSF
ncbi:MAG: ElyC/SanA/YdcF family protein [Alphaproteobacteria bacterium]|nr:ElyC/SanA/YdcF family protein [Alphaproteobacteria bacterium]